MTTQLSFNAIDLVDTNNNELNALNWLGAPYRLGGEPTEGFSTPWANWQVDRALILFPQDNEYSEGLVEEVSEDSAREVCQRLQGEYDFDGEISFVPAAYAEHFWSFLVAMTQASAAGAEEFEFEGGTYPTEEYVSVGDAPLALYGRPTPEGLWILFMDSDETFDLALVLSALEHYPGRTEDTMIVHEDGEHAAFDATRPWSYQHTHLMSALEGVEQASGAGGIFAFVEAALKGAGPAPAHNKTPSP